mmetsp:Transcript_23369/g.43955  ORF Transcript_23369/g.43955 Transcript_23369/m.43955 type:complete len:122 (+) Transcript_23369:50-415(+)
MGQAEVFGCCCAEPGDEAGREVDGRGVHRLEPVMSDETIEFVGDFKQACTEAGKAMDKEVDKAPAQTKKESSGKQKRRNPTLLVGGDGEDIRSLRRFRDRAKVETLDPYLANMAMGMTFTV